MSKRIQIEVSEVGNGQIMLEMTRPYGRGDLLFVNTGLDTSVHIYPGDAAAAREYAQMLDGAKVALVEWAEKQERAACTPSN